jgi:hypothetical protein
MGWKDRMAAGAAKATELARDVADSAPVAKVLDSEPVQNVTDTLAGLRAMFTDEEEREFIVERGLVALVRNVRDDDDQEPLTDRDVEKAAKRRSKRARRTALLAGPAVGTANQIADLYCETATVCDLDRLHGLGLTDELVAAHMLVLWDVTPDLEVAQAAILGTGESVTTLLGKRFGETAAAHMPATDSKRDMLKALWKARGLANDARESVMGERNISGIVFAGKRVKEFIERAEAQLGVMRLT